MLYIIYSLFQILNLIGAQLKKDSKLISLLVIILIWAFIGGNTSSPDTFNYIASYNRIGSGISNNQNIEFGYFFIQKIGNILGLDYMQFRMISIIPSIFLIHITIKRYSDNCHYVYFFYMLYAMIMDTEQIRNFMAISIVIFAVGFLIKGGIQNKVKYMICICLAASIHTTSILYLILIFIKNNNKNRFIKIVVSITLVLCLVTFFNNNNIPFIGDIVKAIDNDKITGYLNTKTRYGFLYVFVLHAFNFIIIFWSRRILKNSNIKNNNSLIEHQTEVINDDNNVKKTSMNFVDLIFWINFISFIFFPLYMMSVTFYRLIRNYIIFNLIVCSLVQKELKKNILKRFAFNFLVLINIGAWFYFDFIIKYHIDDVLIPIFIKNIFFSVK